MREISIIIFNPQKGSEVRSFGYIHWHHSETSWDSVSCGLKQWSAARPRFMPPPFPPPPDEEHGSSTCHVKYVLQKCRYDETYKCNVDVIHLWFAKTNSANCQYFDWAAAQVHWFLLKT